MTHMLRDYEVAAIDKASSMARSICAMEPGLGKTVVAVRAVNNWRMRVNLIVAPEKSWYSANPNAGWINIINNWSTVKADIIPIRGHYNERKKLWDKAASEVTDGQLFILISGDSLISDFKRHTPYGLNFSKIGAYVIDEAHRMRSRKSVLFSWIAKVNKMPTKGLLMTGTPQSKSPTDWWTMLHLCHPKEFSSFWRFADTFTNSFINEWGRREIAGEKNVEQFRKLLNRFAFIATRKSVGWQDPIRELIPIELHKGQDELYNALESSLLYVTDSGEIIMMKNSLEANTRLLQAAVCPAMLHPELGHGAMIEDFAKANNFDTIMSDPDAERPKHVVLFTPFKRALPFFAQYLRSLNNTVYTIHSGVKDYQQQIQRWANSGGTLMCSVDFAESFSLEPAQLGYFLGNSYDPNRNKQAEGRLMRSPDSHPTFRYYTIKGSRIETSQQILNDKQRGINMTTEALAYLEDE